MRSKFHVGATAYAILACSLAWHLLANQNKAQNPVDQRADLGPAIVGQDLAHLGRVVEAQAFALRTRQGKLRGLFSVDPEGLPRLQLLGKGGRALMIASITEDDNPELTLQDARSKVRISLSVMAPEIALVSLEHGDLAGKRESIALVAAAEDLGFSVMENGITRLTVLNSSQGGTISIKDKGGQDALELFVDKDSNGRLTILNSDKTQAIHIPAEPKGDTPKPTRTGKPGRS